MENHTVDSHSGFVFLREDGQLLNAVRDVGKNVEHNNSEVFKVSRVFTQTRTQKKESIYTVFTQNHRKNTEPFENI